MEDLSKMNDHDLLVTMHEQIKGIKGDIKELKDGTSSKLTDHERRLRRLELYCAVAIGGAYALQIYLHYLK